jgi:hypothetical protein
MKKPPYLALAPVPQTAPFEATLAHTLNTLGERAMTFTGTRKFDATDVRCVKSMQIDDGPAYVFAGELEDKSVFYSVVDTEELQLQANGKALFPFTRPITTHVGSMTEMFFMALPNTSEVLDFTTKEEA